MRHCPLNEKQRFSPSHFRDSSGVQLRLQRVKGCSTYYLMPRISSKAAVWLTLLSTIKSCQKYSMKSSTTKASRHCLVTAIDLRPQSLAGSERTRLKKRGNNVVAQRSSPLANAQTRTATQQPFGSDSGQPDFAGSRFGETPCSTLSWGMGADDGRRLRDPTVLAL